MKLSLSNFAWDIEESNSIFEELEKIGITLIEGVLTKIKPWEELSFNSLSDYKKYLNSYNISILSLQSLFYGVKCESILDEENFINHFKKIIEYSKHLSVNTLVFGSPLLRKKEIGWENKLPIIFKKLDNVLNDTGIQIIIEPNSKIYGGEYFFTVSEIVNFITFNKFKNIKTMIDTHNSILEGGDPIDDLKNHIDNIGHIHISEPKLIPITNLEFHNKFSSQLKKIKYDKIITYEVMKCNNIMDSVKNFYEIYK
jgi:sugar phosphate isomerase/epimerase